VIRVWRNIHSKNVQIVKICCRWIETTANSIFSGAGIWLDGKCELIAIKIPPPLVSWSFLNCISFRQNFIIAYIIVELSFWYYNHINIADIDKLTA